MSGIKRTDQYKVTDQDIRNGLTFGELAKKHHTTARAIIDANAINKHDDGRYYLQDAKGRSLIIPHQDTSLDRRARFYSPARDERPVDFAGVYGVPNLGPRPTGLRSIGLNLGSLGASAPAVHQPALKRFNINDRVQVTFTKSETVDGCAYPRSVTYENAVGVVTNVTQNDNAEYVYTIRFDGQNVENRYQHGPAYSTSHITLNDGLISGVAKMFGFGKIEITAGETKQFTEKTATIKLVS